VVRGPHPGQQTLFGVTMPDLGTFLSTLAGRPIRDKTGLTDKYDITYQWSCPRLRRRAVRPNPYHRTSSVRRSLPSSETS
jgi:uncharacterized protein (TIGR03435 family)